MTTIKDVAEMTWIVLRPIGILFVIFSVGRLYQRFTEYEKAMQELRQRIEKLGDRETRMNRAADKSQRLELVIVATGPSAIDQQQVSHASQRWNWREPASLSPTDAEIINPRRTQS